MLSVLAAVVLAGVIASAAASSAPRVAARIHTGAGPCGAASTSASLWVANDGAGTLVRIDPRTNHVTGRIAVGRGACSVAVGAGKVWVTNYKRGTVLRVDPRTGRLRSARVGANPFDVLVAFGRVWVTSWDVGMVVELDPRSMRLVRGWKVGRYAAGLTAAAGAVWVGFGRSVRSIVRLRPRSGRIERVAVGDPRPAWFLEGTRDLWIQASDHHLLHVDPATRRVVGRLDFGRTLAQGARSPDGTLWVPDKERNVVYRVDPRTERVVDSFRAGPGAFAARRAFGSMWVTSYAGNDVWRFDDG